MKLLIAFLILSSVSAKTILISDVDDTIKVAHIRNSFARITNAFRTKNIFLGMAPLYSLLKEDLDAEIYYLSNAPKALMLGSHSALVRNGNFPEGTMLLRPTGVSSKDHKRIALRKLISQPDVDTVILVGDNGEHDITFYDNIAKEYPKVDFHTYIRIAYDLDETSTPKKEQVGFISPFEIALDLADKGTISAQSAGDLYKSHSIVFLTSQKKSNTGMMYLPKWMGCKGHKSTKVLRNFSYLLSVTVNKKINSLCK